MPSASPLILSTIHQRYSDISHIIQYTCNIWDVVVVVQEPMLNVNVDIELFYFIELFILIERTLFNIFSSTTKNRNIYQYRVVCICCTDVKITCRYKVIKLNFPSAKTELYCRWCKNMSITSLKKYSSHFRTSIGLKTLNIWNLKVGLYNKRRYVSCI